MILTQFQMHAGTLDKALRQRWLQIDTFGEIAQSLHVITTEILEGSSQIVGKCFVLSKLVQFQRLVESCRGLLVTIASFLIHGVQS